MAKEGEWAGVHDRLRVRQAGQLAWGGFPSNEATEHL